MGLILANLRGALLNVLEMYAYTRDVHHNSALHHYGVIYCCERITVIGIERAPMNEPKVSLHGFNSLELRRRAHNHVRNGLIYVCRPS